MITDAHVTRIVIGVRDQGPGIPESALAHIFEPFYRVDDSRERNAGGYGIGLTITERTIRRHGGSVRASNLADGGLLVELRLPVMD